MRKLQSEILMFPCSSKGNGSVDKQWDCTSDPRAWQYAHFEKTGEEGLTLDEQ